METVVECKKIKEWNGNPIYGVGLSDGRGGESFQEIPVGTPVSDLVITPNQNPAYSPRIKWNKPGGNHGGGYSGRKSGNESFALSYAKDIVCAGKTDLKNLLPLAEKLYDWLEGKKPKQSATAPQPAQQQGSTNTGGSDDLPF